MTSDDLNYFQSNEGRELLKKHAHDDETTLFRLLFAAAKKKENNHLSALVTLIKLRQKAEGKFKRAEEMFFTTLGLEQATEEKIADLIALRFLSDWKVVDLTSSIGGNLLSLAQRCRRVVAVDCDQENLICARANAQVYGLNEKIEFIEGDATENIVEDADAFFLDPARDREGKTKTRSILNSRPEILKILPEIFKVTRNVGIKISPAFDYRELALLPQEPEIEIISVDNNCKVAMLWFGDLKKDKRRASYFYGNSLCSLSNNNLIAKSRCSEKINNYLYEPNKAISKAHLIDEVAAEYDLKKISPFSSFLSSDKLIEFNCPGLFRIFKLIESGDFSEHNLQTLLKSKKIVRANVISKNFPLKPEEILKRFKIKEGGDLFLIFTALREKKRVYILAEKV